MKTKRKLKDLLNMYFFYYQKHKEKGMLDDIGQRISNGGMKESYDKLITKKYVIKMYHVTEVPRTLSKPLNILLLSTRGRDMLMDIYTYMCREPIDWTSPYMKKVKEAWEKQLKENPSRLNADKLNTAEDYETASKSKAASTSWNLVAQKTSSGSVTIKEETVVIVRYEKPITMQNILLQEDLMLKAAKTYGVVLTPIDKNIKEVFRTISPTAIPDYNPVKAYMTVLDENVAQFETYTSGKLDGSKVFLGVDILTRILVFSELLNTGGGALNAMLVASTGSGKSYYMKAFFPLLAGAGVNTIIWDKDGEYEDQCRQVNALILSLGTTGGKYFNPIPIDLTDVNGYQNSVQEASSYFDLLCDVNNGMTSDEKYLFNLAYSDMFIKHNVIKEDRSTWSNTINLNFNSLYNSFLSIESELPSDIVPQYKSMMRKLFIFFDERGTNKGLFDQELNIREILSVKQNGQPLIICINMQTKTKGEETNNVVDRMKSLTMTYVTDRIVGHNKSIGEETLLVVEEINRHLDNKRFITDVYDNVTGSRKRNIIMFLITNSINNMLNSSNQKVKDMVSNIDTMIIGGVKPSDRELLVEAQSLQNCRKELELIYEMSLEDPKSDNKWKNAFLIKTKKETTIVKMHVPKELSESKMFKTRDDSKTDKI